MCDARSAWRSLVEDMRVLVIDMHRAGINCRFLGVIRQHITNTNLRKSMLIGASPSSSPSPRTASPSGRTAKSPLTCLRSTEMVSRVLKNELREHMRNVRSSSEDDNKAVIATFFGRFLQDPHFWRPGSPSSAAHRSPPHQHDHYHYHYHHHHQQAFDVKQRLQERFPSCLTAEEVHSRLPPLVKIFVDIS